MWTKRELVTEAFAELALQGYEFDITPAEQQGALRRLDAMMAAWEGLGIQVGYLFPSSTASDPDDPSGLPDRAVETVYLNLATRIATGYGKQVSGDTRRNAADGYKALLWAAAQPIEQQFPSTLSRGAGNKPWRNSERQFMPPPDESPLRINTGGDLSILG